MSPQQNATCYGILQLHQSLQFHKQDATHPPLQVSIHHMQARINAILCLGSPCCVHKHELYMLDSKATRVQQLRCKICYQEKTQAKEPVTDNINSAGASHFLFLLYRGMCHRLEWGDTATALEEEIIPVKTLAEV